MPHRWARYTTAMPKRRDIRRLAMQVLYQLDLRSTENPPTADALADHLDDEHDDTPTRLEAAALGLQAWEHRDAADLAVATLAPDWPTHRQPPVDRAILRLAHFEITTGRTPVGVAINEAVELAKQFAAEQSPAFVNGILDKIAKQNAGQIPEPLPAPPTKPNADAWLDDAVNG